MQEKIIASMEGARGVVAGYSTIYKAGNKILSLKPKLSAAEKGEEKSTKKNTRAKYDQAKSVLKLESRLKKLYAIRSRGVKLSATSIASMRKLEARYTAMGGKVKKLEAQHGNLLAKFTKMRWAMVNVAMIAGTLYGIYRGIGQPIVELQSAMAMVRKTTGFTAEETKILRHEIVSLSKVLPQTAKELAEIAGVAGQLGLGADKKTGVQAIKSFTTVAAMMATATEMTAEDAAKALGKITQAFGLPIASVNELGSVINELSNTTAANASEISQSMLKVGAAAANLGISVQVVAALQATLVSAGMQASRAGTRMRAALTKMSTNLEAVAKLVPNKTFKQFSDLMRTDIDSAVLLVIKSLSEMNDEQRRGKDINDAFGSAAGFVINTLSSLYPELTRNIKTANDEMDMGISLLKEVAIQSSTIEGRWSMMTNTLKSSFIEADTWLGKVVNQMFMLSQMSGKGLLESLTGPGTKLEPVGGGLYKQTTSTFTEHYEEILKKERLDPLIEEFFRLQKLLGTTDEQAKKVANTLDGLRDSVSGGITTYTIQNELIRGQIQLGNKIIPQQNTLIERYTDAKVALDDYTRARKAYNEALEARDLDALIKAEMDLNTVVEDINFDLPNEAKAILKLGDAALATTVSVDLLSKAQQKAAFIFGIVNKRMTDDLKELNAQYKEYAKARFEGETAILRNIHELEVAINREKLAQLRLGDSVTSTNDALQSQMDFYETWVDTIHVAIKALIAEGDIMSSDVTKVVKEQQTILLSSTQFKTEEDDEELTKMKELQRARDIARLEYELGIGEQRYQLQEYIGDMERRGQVEWTSASQAISAIEEVKQKIDTLTEKQKSVTENWKNAQNEVKVFQLGVDLAILNANASLESHISILDKAIDKYITLGTLMNGGTSPAYTIAGIGVSSGVAGAFPDLQGAYNRYGKYGDFIMRPGEEPVGFNKDDTVVGFKGDASGLGITIENINISGVSGDPEEFAFQFTTALKNQIITM